MAQLDKKTLDSIPIVNSIDEGISKYVLLEVGSNKYVRSMPYSLKKKMQCNHKDIVDQFKSELQGYSRREMLKNFDYEFMTSSSANLTSAPHIHFSVRGGGFIKYNNKRRIEIYGKSQVYGRANPTIVRKQVKKFTKGKNIEVIVLDG